MSANTFVIKVLREQLRARCMVLAALQLPASQASAHELRRSAARVLALRQALVLIGVTDKVTLSPSAQDAWESVERKRGGSHGCENYIDA